VNVKKRRRLLGLYLPNNSNNREELFNREVMIDQKDSVSSALNRNLGISLGLLYITHMDYCENYMACAVKAFM